MPDPNIREAIAEMNEVLRSRELAGVIFVASATHAHFGFKLDAPWNCIRFERGPEGWIGVRVRLKSSDYASKEEAKRAGELTLGTVLGLENVMEHGLRQLHELGERLSRDLKLAGHVDVNEGPDIEGIERQPLEP